MFHASQLSNLGHISFVVYFSFVWCHVTAQLVLNISGIHDIMMWWPYEWISVKVHHMPVFARFRFFVLSAYFAPHAEFCSLAKWKMLYIFFGCFDIRFAVNMVINEVTQDADEQDAEILLFGCVFFAFAKVKLLNLFFIYTCIFFYL